MLGNLSCYHVSLVSCQMYCSADCPGRCAVQLSAACSVRWWIVWRSCSQPWALRKMCSVSPLSLVMLSSELTWPTRTSESSRWTVRCCVVLVRISRLSRTRDRVSPFPVQILVHPLRFCLVVNRHSREAIHARETAWITRLPRDQPAWLGGQCCKI